MLRTPVASEAEGGAMHEADAKAGNNTLKLGWQILGHFGHIEPKLPTPTVSDQYTDGLASTQQKPGSMHSVTLAQAVIRPDLLPTPTVVDLGNNKTVEEWETWTKEQRDKHNNGNGHGASLSIEVQKLLPTPNTMDHLPPRTPEALAEAKKRSPAGFSNLRERVVNDLLPTTTASDWKGANNSGSGSASANGIATVVTNLLPTATARDFKDGQAKHHRNGKLQTDTIARAVNELTETWGKFAPAINRWEQILGRPAPAPTNPDGKENKHRLSSRFTEWLMGLPEGWITNVGLTRAEELKACGNGVVPQQAKLALAILLDGVEW